MFTLKLEGSDMQMVSGGKGRTTCAYYLRGGKHILYSSTAPRGGPECPPPPDWSKGYRWAIYPTYDIIVADADGSHSHAITDTGYNAEATLSPDGKTIAFFSTHAATTDIYTMAVDGTNL